MSRTDKPTVVFLSGLGLNGKAYAPGLRLLKKEYDVHAMDFMDYRTSATLALYEPGITVFSKYVADSIRQQRLPTPLYLVGHSLGGGVAIKVAAEHPELVRGLVLLDSVGAGLQPSWPLLVTASIASFWPGWSALLPLAQTLGSNIQRHPRDLWSLLVRHVKTADLSPELRRIHAPAVVVHARGDHVVTAAQSQKITALLTDGKLRLVNGNHGWMFHNWNLFARTVRKAIRSLSPDSA